MNYPYSPYGFNGGFGPQMRSGGFSAPMGYPSPPTAPQSAPASVSAASGGFVVQPVTSREEALAVIADPLSAGVLLPDLGHGVIYVKRFNANTGASDFGEFAFVQPKAAEPVQAAPEFVSAEVFNNTVEKLRAEIAALRRPTGKVVKRDDAADE